VLTSSRKKLPFGIGQIGKSFRNEITPGNFTFRTREFEQMEIEYFCKPGTEDEHYKLWIQSRYEWYVRYGIKPENLRLRPHGADELAHYARGCTDVEYLFPMGWSELEGIASRGDYDLKQHTKFSGKGLDYFDDETRERFVPYVVEPAAGADRATLAFLVDAYREEQVKDEKRVVLGFHPEVAPVKIAVLPLLKKREDVVATARALAESLRRKWVTVYDDTAAIGKLYRRQDEVGTPYCITVDVQTVGESDKGEVADNKVTIRERDSMEQIRIPIDSVAAVMETVLMKGWAARPQ
jgi:glycyl-tRNA synthetase